MDDDRPLMDDEDVNPSVSPLGSALSSWGETKWGDTAAYAAKKINSISSSAGKATSNASNGGRIFKSIDRKGFVKEEEAISPASPPSPIPSTTTDDDKSQSLRQSSGNTPEESEGGVSRVKQSLTLPVV
ncbi:hypothetical protein L1887_07597 [Cichorium endivia]|nr:hypothetical protein L1887_07597 [Cichorium endivia]